MEIEDIKLYIAFLVAILPLIADILTQAAGYFPNHSAQILSVVGIVTTLYILLKGILDAQKENNEIQRTQLNILDQEFRNK